MYFTIITALKKLFKNKIVIYKIKLFSKGELFLKKINLKYIEVINTSSRGRTGTMLPSLDFEVLINSNQKYNINLIKLENIFNFWAY